jgi:Arc/MetJ-type ribon-helix-helix transcriptional regulator
MEKEKETALTLKFKGVESRLLEELVRNGLFSSKSEAIRAALIHYFIQLGMLGREQQWKEIQTFPKRKVSPEQLQKDLEIIKDEV